MVMMAVGNGGGFGGVLMRRWWRRVVASGVVDRVDRVKGSVFGFGQKARRKSFLTAANSGRKWPEVVAGGSREGGGDDDGYKVVVAAAVDRDEGGVTTRGGDWYGGSNRSGDRDHFWVRQKRSPEKFSGSGGGGRRW
nr:hypothetical protein [Tanacetum cinerariifolium]